VFVCVCVSIVALSHITVVVDTGYLTLEEEYIFQICDHHFIYGEAFIRRLDSGTPFFCGSLIFGY